MASMTGFTGAVRSQRSEPSARRFGGVLWRIARRTTGLARPFAGKPWNPIFSVVEHRGRRSGRRYDTPVAARRVPGGFVVSLAFGAHVDWYRNLVAADGGAIRWRGERYPVSAPERIDARTGSAPFHPVQRLLLRLTGIDGFVRLRDGLTSSR
jgi:deazaflavin-dependent oxidoreductase (nitroreductase family)